MQILRVCTHYIQTKKEKEIYISQLKYTCTRSVISHNKKTIYRKCPKIIKRNLRLQKENRQNTI